MNIEELTKMTESELHARANAHLEHLDDATTSELQKEHYVSQAQFYLAEIDRREQAQERIESARIARRDYKLELWVIWLIGAELLLAVLGLIFGWVEGKKQMEVLNNLNQSSAETAATLTAVRQAQEASLDTQKHTLENIVTMNDALQEQIDWNFADVLQMSGSSGDGRFSLVYRGRTNLFLWGSMFDGESPVMQQKATTLTLGNSYNFDISRLLFEKMTEGSQEHVPFELYLKASNGTKYVAKSTLAVTRQKDNLMIWCETIAITRKQW
jgi:hypothetical protein